jgi:hypothetical protein
MKVNMKKTKKISETQIGAISESMAATRLMIESNGRLSPFEPIADDMGIDLLLYDKKTGGAVPLQIKSRTKTLKRHPKIVHFELRRATFNEEQDAYLLAVFVDLSTNELNIKRAWLVPMRELVSVSAKREKKYVIRPSIDMNSQDRYRPYRCKDISEVTNRLIRHFEEVAK